MEQIKKIELSNWAEKVITDMKASLGGQVSFSDTDAIDGALFLMCILPASQYVSIENHLIQMSKEGCVRLSLEEEMKVMHAFKSMYSLDQSGRRQKFYGLIEDKEQSDDEV